jgi:hypothetical protein
MRICEWILHLFFTDICLHIHTASLYLYIHVYIHTASLYLSTDIEAAES